MYQRTLGIDLSVGPLRRPDQSSRFAFAVVGPVLLSPLARRQRSGLCCQISLN
jgi:hypothetical protein